jgi:hypothetical protein
MLGGVHQTSYRWWISMSANFKRLLTWKNAYIVLSTLINVILSIFIFFWPKPADKKLAEFSKSLDRPNLTAILKTDIFPEKYLDSGFIPITGYLYICKRPDFLNCQKWIIDSVEVKGLKRGFLIITANGNTKAENVILEIHRGFSLPIMRLYKPSFWSADDSIEWQETRSMMFTACTAEELNMYEDSKKYLSIYSGEHDISIGDFQPGQSRTIPIEFIMPEAPEDTTNCSVNKLKYEGRTRRDFVEIIIRADNQSPIKPDWIYYSIDDGSR